jgi:hypothetical protein
MTVRRFCAFKEGLHGDGGVHMIMQLSLSANMTRNKCNRGCISSLAELNTISQYQLIAYFVLIVWFECSFHKINVCSFQSFAAVSMRVRVLQERLRTRNIRVLLMTIVCLW